MLFDSQSTLGSDMYSVNFLHTMIFLLTQSAETGKSMRLPRYSPWFVWLHSDLHIRDPHDLGITVCSFMDGVGCLLE
jgi:hypothetical protein